MARFSLGRRILKLGLVGRGTNSEFYGLRQGPIIAERTQEIGLHDLYQMAQRCNAVRKSIQALRDYLFKEGYVWSPEYSKKCKSCGYKHPKDYNPDECVRCGGTEFLRPDPALVEDADRFFKRVDLNGHTFLEVLKLYEENLNIADDSFLVVAKDYELGVDGSIEGWQIKELHCPDTRTFKIIIDAQTQVPGGMWYICLRHRPVTYKDPVTRQERKSGRVYNAPGNCVECGGRLYDVWYVSTIRGTSSGANPTSANIAEYYIGDVNMPNGTIAQEVIHNSKYSNTYGYGYSPIISVWDMAKTLVKMEEYTRKFYEEERTPRSAIFIPTNNPAAVRAAWKEAEDKYVSQGPGFIPKFTYDAGSSSGNRPVQYMEFSKLPQELQMIETSDYYYRRIGSAFGVAPVFHGNVDAVGMQQQGPTQWQVTVLAAQVGQSLYNDKLLPALCQQLGIHGEWDLRLVEVEEKDEAQKIQLDLMKVQEAQQKIALGLQFQGVDESGNYLFGTTPQVGMGQSGMDAPPSGPRAPGGMGRSMEQGFQANMPQPTEPRGIGGMERGPEGKDPSGGSNLGRAV